MIEHFKKFFSLGFFPEELPPEFGPYGITEEVASDLWDRIDELSDDPDGIRVSRYEREINENELLF